MASMTLVEFTKRKSKTKTTKTTAIIKCDLLRRFSSFGFPQISTQKLVVIAVKAESALENEAAKIPKIKSTTTAGPNSQMLQKLVTVGHPSLELQYHVDEQA